MLDIGATLLAVVTIRQGSVEHVIGCGHLSCPPVACLCIHNAKVDEACQAVYVGNMTKTTKGHRMLARAISGKAQAEAARMAGLTPAEINHIVKGRRGASMRQAVAIRDAFGVPVDAWLK